MNETIEIIEEPLSAVVTRGDTGRTEQLAVQSGLQTSSVHHRRLLADRFLYAAGVNYEPGMDVIALAIRHGLSYEV